MDIFVVTKWMRMPTIGVLGVHPGVYPGDELFLVQMEKQGIEHPKADPLLSFYQDGNLHFLWQDGVWRHTGFDNRLAIAKWPVSDAATRIFVTNCANSFVAPASFRPRWWRALYRVNWPQP